MIRRSILVITPRYPYPVIGGDRLRIFEICRELSRHHDLTLLSLCETYHEFNAKLPNDGIFSRIERVWLPRWRSVLNVMLAIPTNIPLQIAYYKSSEFSKRLKTLLPQHDLCLAHLIRAGDYLRDSSIPKVLEMTDAISLNYQRVSMLGLNRGLKSLVYRAEVKRLVKYERKAIKDYSAVILVSNIDRDFLLQGEELDNVLVCSNGVDLNLLPFRDRKDSSPVAVFIGNMTSIQNLDACLYFAEEILPLIRQKIDCRFRVVGRINPGDAKRLTKFEGVEVFGNVKSIADAVLDARVGVAPIRLGAGVQNKVLEYMALGLPVIASPIAFEGLQAQQGRDLLIAKSPEEYVQHLSVLWEDNIFRAALSQNGLSYVRSYHSWQKRLEPILTIIDKVLEG